MEDTRIEEREEQQPAEEKPGKSKPGIKNRLTGLKDKAFQRFPRVSEKLLRKKVLIPLGCAVLAVTALIVVPKLGHKESNDAEYEMVKAEKRDIIRTVDGSSVLAANDTYNVTALVTGEILSDTFSEGDIVKKDQPLYRIDSEDAQRTVDNAKNALTKANQALADAVKKRTNTITANSNSKKSTQNAVAKALENVETAKRSLESAQNDSADLFVKANASGVISNMNLREGDQIHTTSVFCNIFDTKILEAKIPFNSSETDMIHVGSPADIKLAASGEAIWGEVESVSDAEIASASNAIVRYVTVKMDNPGGLKAGDQVSAIINGIACVDIAQLEYHKISDITPYVDGKIKSVNVDNYDYVTEGQVIAVIESYDIEKNVKDAQASLNNSQLDLDDAYTKLAQLVVDNDTYALDSAVSAAKLDVDNAKLSLETAQKKLEDYEITAPIDGTIITKNKKAGDKLEQNNNSTNEPMAIIYDMSLLKVELSVDESEIQDIKVGQRVDITADAADGEFHGKVTKVGINGTSQNGVTVYPVEITITEYGDLLPGMNVDCVISVESAKDVVAVPVSAIQRGSRVYMKGEKKDEKDRAPEGFYSVEVKTGATDSEYIEIKKGIKEGDEVRGALKPTGVEAEGTGEQQQMPGGGYGGGYGGPPGGGYGGNRGGYGGGPGGGMR